MARPTAPRPVEPSEEARAVANEIANYVPIASPTIKRVLSNSIAFALDAYAAERVEKALEEAAKLADQYTDSPSDHEAGTALNIAAEIRARKDLL